MFFRSSGPESDFQILGTRRAQNIYRNEKNERLESCSSQRKWVFWLLWLVNKIELSWRPTADEIQKLMEADPSLSQEAAENTRCTIFLGMTSNMVSSGTREVIRYLCEHNMVIIFRIRIIKLSNSNCCHT